MGNYWIVWEIFNNNLIFILDISEIILNFASVMVALGRGDGL